MVNEVRSRAAAVMVRERNDGWPANLSLPQPGVVCPVDHRSSKRAFLGSPRFSSACPAADTNGPRPEDMPVIAIRATHPAS